MRDAGLAVRSGLRIEPDASRVVTRLFIPGQELAGGSESRTSITVERLEALDEDEVVAELASVVARFGGRHDDLEYVFEQHAVRVESFVRGTLSPARRRLLGAIFTHEFSLEGSSVCNPSLVPAPGPRDADGALDVVLSYRSIGEGHRSTLNFRTGRIDARRD